MNTIFGLFTGNPEIPQPLPPQPPIPNNIGNDYKTQIESQLSRIESNRIPISKMNEKHKQKNARIISGLNEIVGIIEESKQHFGDFQLKINKLIEKSGSTEQTIQNVSEITSKQEKLGKTCDEEISKIRECEQEKNRLIGELTSKVENIRAKDGELTLKNQEIEGLKKQLESLQKEQSSNILSVSSANEELIKYNKSLVEKIKEIADAQSRIIEELDNDLENGTEVESTINTVKGKLIELVDTIDDENNRLGSPQLIRSGRTDANIPKSSTTIAQRPTRPPPSIPQSTLQSKPVVSLSRGAPPPFGVGFLRGGNKTKKRSKTNGGKGKNKYNRKHKTRTKSKK
jgi:hypothetical protein